MLHHIVLLKPKEGTTEVQLDALCQNVGLLNGIEGVISAHVEVNGNKNNRGFTHAIIVGLKDGYTIDDYLNHPNHEKFARAYLRPIRDETIVFDYTT